MDCRRNERRSAFTLVELLVVVGIIAILISLLLPAVQRAVYQSRVVNCASNIRQYAAAMTVYAAKNDGMLPAIDNSSVGARNAHDLPLAWLPMLKKCGMPDTALFCPLVKETVYDDGTYKNSGFLISSYSVWVPRNVSGNTSTYTPLPPDPPNTVAGEIVRGPRTLMDKLASANPILSDDVLLFLTATSAAAAPNYNFGDAPPTDIYQKYCGHTYGGRIRSSNSGYVDGHVEYVPAAEIKIRFASGNAWNCR